MSLAILFHFLCAQHVSHINISIIWSLRLFCWITTFIVLLVRCVLEFRCGWVGVVSVLQAEAWKWNKIASDIKLVFYSSTVLEWFFLKILPLGNHGFIAVITLKNDEPNFVSQISDSLVSVILFRYTTWCLIYETFCRSVSSYIYQEIVNCLRSSLSLYETQFCPCHLIRTTSMMAGSSFPHSLYLSIHSAYTIDHEVVFDICIFSSRLEHGHWGRIQ